MYFKKNLYSEETQITTKNNFFPSQFDSLGHVYQKLFVEITLATRTKCIPSILCFKKNNTLTPKEQYQTSPP